MIAVHRTARHVRRLAAQRSLPITHVADRAGVGRTTLFRLLDAVLPSDPRLSTVEALAKVLQVDVVELLQPPDAPLRAEPRVPVTAPQPEEEHMTLDGALGALRALTERARESADVCVAVPFEVADGIARLGTEARVADLLATLDALDLADCSPRMIQRRVVLGSRLRLDATDDEARAQTANLLATAKLRRRLGNAMGDAIEADNATAAYRMRSLLIAADDESAGWQEDALRALDGPERKGQKRD